MITLYPSAVQLPAHATNYRKAGRRGFSRVIIHCTDGHGDPRATASMWQEAHHGSSAHFVVGQDGTIVQAVSIADIAWHAHAANSLSVGIEHCARTPHELGSNDPGLPLSTVQFAASAQLCAWLCRQAGIVPSRATIRGHAEVDPETTHADCPTGCGFDLDAYAVRVAAEHDALFA